MAFFSVLIPSFNRPEYLPLAVTSVLASDLDDFELIVSDDCSPRQTEIIAALAAFAPDPRFVLEIQARNLGEANNRQFLMGRARGSYHIIMGDDDLLAKDALSKLRLSISKQPHFDFYLFGYRVIDEDGRLFEIRRALAPLELAIADTKVMEDVFSSDLFPFWLYHPATFCFPASLHRDVAPNGSIGIGDDLIFLFDALLAGKRALVVPDALFSYRKFIGPRAYAQTNRSQGQLANILTRRHILYNLLTRDSFAPKLRSFIHGFDFRRRFLYNSIITEPDSSEAILDQIGLTPEHLAEAHAYWIKQRGPWFASWLQWRRVVAYSRYFGVRGLLESVKVFWQRRTYRRSITRP